jgi:hypothetical protein
MRALLFFSLFSVSLSSAKGQQLGFSGGYCYNDLYNSNDYSQTSLEYEDGNGYSLSLNLDNIKLVDKMWADTFRFSFALNFSYYDGSIQSSSIGGAGGHFIEGDFEKSVLGLRIYLLNFRFLKEFNLGVGLESNYMISSSTTGTEMSWLMGSGTSYNLEDLSSKIFSDFQMGLVGRMSYNFPVRNNWYVVPEYNFYLGFCGEYDHFDKQVHSIRHYFMLGVAYRFK